MGRYFEYTSPDTFYRSAGDGINGSVGLRADFKTGAVNTGDIKVSLGRVPSAYHKSQGAFGEDLTEVYMRYYVRNDPDWEGPTGMKLSRITALHATWGQSMIAHTWSEGSPNYLTIDPASGIDLYGRYAGDTNAAHRGDNLTLKSTKYNDFANLKWLGIKQGITPLFDSDHVGEWYCVETHVKLNDPGEYNGVFELWIDDGLEAGSYNLNWIGSYEMGPGKGFGMNTFSLENVWNDGSPKAQSRYFDNLVIGRSKIGPAEIRTLNGEALITNICEPFDTEINNSDKTVTIKTTFVTKIDLTAGVSDGAAVSYWTDVACTNELSATEYANYLLDVSNTLYIKVVSEDELTTNIYTVTVTAVFGPVGTTPPPETTGIPGPTGTPCPTGTVPPSETSEPSETLRPSVTPSPAPTAFTPFPTLQPTPEPEKLWGDVNGSGEVDGEDLICLKRYILDWEDYLYGGKSGPGSLDTDFDLGKKYADVDGDGEEGDGEDLICLKRHILDWEDYLPGAENYKGPGYLAK